MTLPKGYGSGARRTGAGGSSDDVERMIGRRVEHMNGIFILGFALTCGCNGRRSLCRSHGISVGISIA